MVNNPMTLVDPLGLAPYWDMTNNDYIKPESLSPAYKIIHDYPNNNVGTSTQSVSPADNKRKNDYPNNNAGTSTWSECPQPKNKFTEFSNWGQGNISKPLTNYVMENYPGKDSSMLEQFLWGSTNTLDLVLTFNVATGEIKVIQGINRAGKAYDIARQGGKHAGFYKQYLNKSNDEIQNGIQSFKKQIAEHQDKIANPEKYIPNFRQLDPRQQEALVTKKWPSDIQRQMEQKDILEGILRGR